MNPVGLPNEGYWIYLILGPTGKVYVGKSKSPYRRCHQYSYAFRNRLKKSINTHLMNAFVKHGYDDFRMILLEKCNDENHTSDREIFWIDHFDSTNRDKGYNLRRDSSTGMIAHSETKVKISDNLKQQWASGVRDDHAEKLRDSWNRRDRKAQSVLFTQLKTRWRYFVTFADQKIELNYHGLRALKLWSGAVTAFSRQRTNIVIVKGFKIERVQYDG